MPRPLFALALAAVSITAFARRPAGQFPDGAAIETTPR